MYATLAINNSKRSGNIVGTHQKLDKISYKIIKKALKPDIFWPTQKEVLLFEGMGGPDGLKRKSPGKDEPMHFIIPDHDDGKLIRIIEDNQYNLSRALKSQDEIRAAFEAAWMAHAVTDGLTPAHHFPLEKTQKELMTRDEFIKLFGIPVKGIMRGQNAAETLRNNWLYWGANGAMSKHVAFEYGVAITMTGLSSRHFRPKITMNEIENADLHEAFYSALKKVANLDMYTRFRYSGWTTDLALETKDILLPTIIKAIVLCWASSIPDLKSSLRTDIDKNRPL